MTYAVTDNASNMVRAFNLLSEPTAEDIAQAEMDEAEFTPPFRVPDSVRRLGCFAHTIQLCVNDALKNRPDMKVSCHAVYLYISYNVQDVSS